MRRPGLDRSRRSRFWASWERLESRQLLATFQVLNTNDAGPGSLRSAIIAANNRPGADNIVFDIPASTSPNLDVPVEGFDPITQTWRIRLSEALPEITDPLTIDGYSQAQFPVGFRYPQQISPDPTPISSTPNTVPAKDGNNAAVRVIIDGSGAAGATGFVMRASHSILRGLAIDGFDVGVSVPDPGVVGVLIQGNFIGRYFVFRVNSSTGEPLTGGGQVSLVGQGNLSQGILLGSTNVTVGGINPQENNVIAGNGLQGVAILLGAQGNQIIGNQIGVAGPTSNGLYVVAGNRAEGVWIGSSSNYVGGTAPGAGNLISGNRSHGVRITGAEATKNQVKGNFIGVGPGGGLRFGVLNPGNLGDGVLIEGVGSTTVGGPGETDRNVISANEGAGIRIIGPLATGNQILGNFIGLTAGGNAALGNSLEGVAIATAGNVVGPGNVISANLRGVWLVGLGATRNLIQDNRIGTDARGIADLGNAFEGVRVDGAANNLILGDAAGSQVITGNDVGVLIIGQGATGNGVQGNFIGPDLTGRSPLGNSKEGVRIDHAPNNVIGGTTAASRNVISSNHWGVTIAGPLAFNNIVQGNAIGSDTIGMLPLGNELEGVLITDSANDNWIGGWSVAAGNTIAFNLRDGVRVQDGLGPLGTTVRNRILTNRIFLNLGLGINLVVLPDPPSPTPNDSGDGDVGPNLLQNYPNITRILPGSNSTTLRGYLDSTPNTTFTLQFFADGSPDPTGLPEGERFLGQMTVTTDQGGIANFEFVASGLIAAGEFVTATATDPPGNTSEFSIPLGVVQFASAGFTVVEGDVYAVITVIRSGFLNQVGVVDYATADGTARAGLDYLPASGRLVFEPGETTKTILVRILADTLDEGQETVRLILFNPSDGAILEGILTIRDIPPDRNGPIVRSVRAISGRRGVAAVVVAFDEQLDTARAQDLVNYGYSVRIPGRDGRLGTRDDLLIGLRSAIYDPVARTVTLPLARSVRARQRMKFLINQATDVAGAGRGVADLDGNLLDGDGDGQPGGAFSAVVVARPAPKRVRAGAGVPFVGRPKGKPVVPVGGAGRR